MMQQTFLKEIGDNLDYSKLKFNGADYDPGRDNRRLGPQLQRVKDFMSDGNWWSLEEIARGTNDPVTSVSAQLRHLRKKRFGGFTVERKHEGGGFYRYRVL